MHHIGKVRSQPEHVRRHILHVSVLICAGILFLLWIYTLGTNFSNPETQAGVSKDLQPFSNLKNSMVNGSSDNGNQPSGDNSNTDLQNAVNNL